MTGDPRTDFLLAAGPRAFGPDVPDSVRETIAKSASLGWYRKALLGMSQNQQAMMFAEIRQVGRENRRIEYKAVNGLGLPYCRIPFSVMEHFRALYGQDCWRQPDFMEDFLRHHPECRIIVKRGTRGQKYTPPPPPSRAALTLVCLDKREVKSVEPRVTLLNRVSGWLDAWLNKIFKIGGE